jgi:hypothetical protein
MSFVAKLQRAREILEQQHRLSVRALGRELDVGGAELEELIEELVGVQGVDANLGHISVSSGRLDGALRLFDEALEIAGDDPHVGLERVGLSIQVWTGSRRGWVQVEMGRLALGVADLEVGLRRAREMGQWEVASWTLMFHVFADEYAGNPADGLRHARESLECAERAGSHAARLAAVLAAGEEA